MSIRLKINGKYLVSGSTLLSSVISEAGFRRDRIAVELNGEIVPKAEYDGLHLKDGDTVEIFGFVGGG